MKSFFLKLYTKFRNLILYGIIGCCSSGLDFLVYTFFVQTLGIFYIVANSISVIVGIATSFTLNRAYNFKVKDKTAQRFAIFLTVGLYGMLLSNLILYVCIDQLNMNKIISKLLSIVLVVILQFIANKYITFRTTNNKQ